MMRRRQRPKKTIFSPHNVEQIKKFCRIGLRVENILEKEIERIAKEKPEEERSKAAQLELIKRHRETAARISLTRLELAGIMKNIDVDVMK
jgi:hypothetical protein